MANSVLFLSSFIYVAEYINSCFLFVSELLCCVTRTKLFKNKSMQTVNFFLGRYIVGTCKENGCVTHFYVPVKWPASFP